MTDAEIEQAWADEFSTWPEWKQTEWKQRAVYGPLTRKGPLTAADVPNTASARAWIREHVANQYRVLSGQRPEASCGAGPSSGSR